MQGYFRQSYLHDMQGLASQTMSKPSTKGGYDTLHLVMLSLLFYESRTSEGSKPKKLQVGAT
jgi:hypothetical protein